MKQLPAKYHTKASCQSTWNSLSDGTRKKYERYMSRVPYLFENVEEVIAHMATLKVWSRIDTIHGILYQDISLEAKQRYYTYYNTLRGNTYVTVDFTQLTFCVKNEPCKILLAYLYGHLLKEITIYIKSLELTESRRVTLEMISMFTDTYGPFPVLYTFRGEGLRFCKIWFHEVGPVPDTGNYLDVDVNGQMVMYLRQFKNVKVIDYDTTQRFSSIKIAQLVRSYGHEAYLIQTMRNTNGIQQSHFCKLVKSIFGITPSGLRHLDSFNPANGEEKLRVDAFIEEEQQKAKKNFHSYRTQQKHYVQTPSNMSK